MITLLSHSHPGQSSCHFLLVILKANLPLICCFRIFFCVGNSDSDPVESFGHVFVNERLSAWSSWHDQGLSVESQRTRLYFLPSVSDICLKCDQCASPGENLHHLVGICSSWFFDKLDCILDKFISICHKSLSSSLFWFMAGYWWSRSYQAWWRTRHVTTWPRSESLHIVRPQTDGANWGPDLDPANFDPARAETART